MNCALSWLTTERGDWEGLPTDGLGGSENFLSMEGLAAPGTEVCVWRGAENFLQSVESFACCCDEVVNPPKGEEEEEAAAEESLGD